MNDFYFSAMIFSFCTVISSSALAQITVTEDDMPAAGTTYVLQESTPDLADDYSTTGEEMIWDYSGLDSNLEVEIPYSDIDNAPALAQFSFNNEWTNGDYLCTMFGLGEFPDLGALGEELPVELGDLFNYFQTSDGSYNIAGISMNIQGVDIPIEYSDIDEMHPLPLNYGDVISSTSAYSLEVPTAFSYSTEGTREGEVDGWGTLKLPNGEEHEVLRLFTNISKSDVFTQEGGTAIPFGYDIAQYQWIGDGGVPYLEVSAVFGNAFRVRYLGDAPSGEIDGIASVEQSAFQIYPNPVVSGSDITISHNDANWMVRDASGKIISTGTSKNIGTEGLGSGAYFVSITNLETGLMSAPTILIVK